MPLDLSIPPIVVEGPQRPKRITRVIETVLVLGIVFLSMSTLASFLWPSGQG